MCSEDNLRATMSPPDSGASLAATRHAGLARIEPLTATAEAWPRAYVDPVTSWDGSAAAIELATFLPLPMPSSTRASHLSATPDPAEALVT